MLPNASNDRVSPGVRWDIQPVSFMRNYQSFQRNTIKSPDFKSCWYVSMTHTDTATDKVSLEIWQSGTGQGW